MGGGLGLDAWLAEPAYRAVMGTFTEAVPRVAGP